MGGKSESIQTEQEMFPIGWWRRDGCDEAQRLPNIFTQSSLYLQKPMLLAVYPFVQESNPALALRVYL